MQRVSVESECRDRVPLNPDTHLGAFGPGADPTRSRTAYPPPHLAVNFFFVFAVGVLDLDWVSWRPD